MRKFSLHIYLLGFVAAAISFSLLLLAMAWLLRPNMSLQPESYPIEHINEVLKARKAKFDPNDPLILYKNVNYSEGTSGRWYPKGQSPILAELVKEWKLPPVAERVGPEPMVVEGVEGIGKYGGTWFRVASSPQDVGIVGWRLAPPSLVSWSPYGFPIIPNLAKSWEVSDNYQKYVFTLRKGVRWSDGHPFTADDIVYWYKEQKEINRKIPLCMKAAGEMGIVEKIDDYHIKFSFPKPNGLFLQRIAARGCEMVNSPAHYLAKYNPLTGNPEVIKQAMIKLNLPSSRAVYTYLKDVFNPEHPRMWPWVYKTYKANPPYEFVRNPYYYVVDPDGNQLPYIDRVLFNIKTASMIGITAANGEIAMQSRHIKFDDYTLLMSQQKKYNYKVLHWFSTERSQYAISVNLNRKIDPDRPETAKKNQLLNNKKFRQALSLAINRQNIINAVYNGMGKPAQVAPSPVSAFYEPTLYKSFVEYDSERANRLLDEIRLMQRDREGYRTFRDGSRMTFYLNLPNQISVDPAQFIVEDWKNIGIRAIIHQRARRLFFTEKEALEHDFNVWGGCCEFMPLLEPRYFVPYSRESNYAPAFAKWYINKGLYGDPCANNPGCLEPSKEHPLRKAMEIYEKVITLGRLEEQVETFREVLKIAAENVWSINIATPTPVLVVVKDGLHNVPEIAVSGSLFCTPANTGIDTYFFDNPSDSLIAIEHIKESIAKIVESPFSSLTTTFSVEEKVENEIKSESVAQHLVSSIVKYLLIGIAILFVLLTAVKHPYIGKRLLIMVPTLMVVSVLMFIIIQLPPGDFLTSRIMQLQESGETAELQQIEDIRKMFWLDKPMHVRYAKWMGISWFKTFKTEDKGLLQGNLGRSMEDNRQINEIVGDRIILTLLISVGTILFTWAVAIPIGIYSAVKQYSIGDYIFTFLGFIGMCIPSFLLALLLLYASAELFGIKVSGLFSNQYAAQPQWSWGKVGDLLQHIWVPIAVLGVGGTAGMIRVMRSNLLDELKKPYVITAIAKGVRPIKLLFKYPIRIAINPFVSGIGTLFPKLISGGAIVAMVLSLPTVGPLMLSAVMNEDMYLAGSMLMVLSLLGIFGTLVSDLLLLWLDPRIRFQGDRR